MASFQGVRSLAWRVELAVPDPEPRSLVRGWYHRVVSNPEVELVRGGKAEPYRAVLLDTPEAVDTVTKLMGKGSRAGCWVGRTMLLWAPIKPVRLDPKATEPSATRGCRRRARDDLAEFALVPYLWFGRILLEREMGA